MAVYADRGWKGDGLSMEYCADLWLVWRVAWKTILSTILRLRCRGNPPRTGRRRMLYVRDGGMTLLIIRLPPRRPVFLWRILIVLENADTAYTTGAKSILGSPARDAV